VKRGELLLIVRRPEGGRLGGLWEFPGVHRRQNEALLSAAARAASEWADVDARPVALLGQVRHAFTHVRVVYDVIEMSPLDPLPEDAPTPPGVAWVHPAELRQHALPKAQQRIAELVG
jgi:adenine-specific DNA glycosylase